MRKLEQTWHTIPSPAILLKIANLEVVWLSGSAEVITPEQALTEDELAYAKTIKAKQRRREYIRTRWLVRTCLNTREQLPRKTSGEPSWPTNYIGSITHKEGHCGITVASPATCKGLGIDAENPIRVRNELVNKILAAREIEMLKSLTNDDHEFRDLLAVCFSFKESLFKAHYPIGQEMFYFHDAEITDLDTEARQISAKVLVPTSPVTPVGHTTHGAYLWHTSDERRLVITAALLD